MNLGAQPNGGNEMAWGVIGIIVMLAFVVYFIKEGTNG